MSAIISKPVTGFPAQKKKIRRIKDVWLQCNLCLPIHFSDEHTEEEGFSAVLSLSGQKGRGLHTDDVNS